METELRQERALVAEMEKIGDLTRAELAQVVSQTDSTRSALADSSAQIRLLKERLASQVYQFVSFYLLIIDLTRGLMSDYFIALTYS